MSYYKYLRNVKESKRDLLSKWCVENVKKQKQIEYQFKKHPNQLLIRDKNGNYKKVNKSYYLYYMDDNEYDTEEELFDEEWISEVQRIKNKYT